MTEAEVKKAVKDELQEDAVNELSDTAFKRVINKTSSETGWSLPVAGNFKTFWFVERTVRHCLYMLCTKTAPDFKYKQISLNQPWEHYWEMIKHADEAFKEAVNENPEQFPVEVDATTIASLGVYIEAGFSYDSLGRDTTYNSDHDTNFEPKETDV